jgi:ABC-type polysaccharide/polyol phosphate export permease
MTIFFTDILAGLRRYFLWSMLGWQDVARRYRRSMLGPLWILITSSVMIGVMGPLYAYLFKIEMGVYVLYLATSILSWQFLSTSINEMPTTFQQASGFITDVNLPFSSYIFQMLWRNLIVYAHSLALILFITLVTNPANLAFVPLFPLNLLLVLVNMMWVAFVLAILGTRYRDLSPIIGSLTQIAFFVTPIIWHPDMLGMAQWVNYINPFYHVIEMLRAPFMGQVPDTLSYVFLSVSAVVGMMLAALLFRRAAPRLAYWL